MKKAASLIEAPNIDKKPDSEKLQKLLAKAKDTKERNQQILHAYEEGYSQHKIAEVLGLSQPTVNGIIKRTKNKDTITITSYVKKFQKNSLYSL
jgi:DNA-binding transcriptional regulator LsrR (DeoR family)